MQFKFAKQANGNSTSLLYGQVDLGNIIVAGHSMGATCAIMAGKRLSNPENKVIDPASIKGIVTQHPGICGPFGPPPWPNTWLMSDLATLNAKFPVLFTTATNDAAFLAKSAYRKARTRLLQRRLGIEECHRCTGSICRLFH